MGKKKVFLLKLVLAFLSYLKFRQEFPYVVNKKVNWQRMPVNCNEKTLDVTSYLKYDVTPNISLSHVFSKK